MNVQNEASHLNTWLHITKKISRKCFAVNKFGRGFNFLNIPYIDGIDDGIRSHDNSLYIPATYLPPYLLGQV